jgi:hypothetical protein
MKQSKTYKAWNAMNQRCNNINCKDYHYYGGRNIKICGRWLSKNNGFQNFLKDMGECPIRLTLDRIDNNKNYYKENCRWTTQNKQNRNTRQNINILLNGKLLCLKDHCKELNLNYNTINIRILRGWTPEKALIIPIRKRRKYE